MSTMSPTCSQNAGRRAAGIHERPGTETESRERCPPVDRRDADADKRRRTTITYPVDLEVSRQRDRALLVVRARELVACATAQTVCVRHGSETSNTGKDDAHAAAHWPSVLLQTSECLDAQSSFTVNCAHTALSVFGIQMHCTDF